MTAAVDRPVVLPVPRARRRLAAELRRLRLATGMRIGDVAERLDDMSASKLSRIETNTTGVTPGDVRALLTLYGVSGEIAEGYVAMAREVRQYGQVTTSPYAGLEAAAAEIRAFEAQSVPSLLQIDGYARALTMAGSRVLTVEGMRRRLRDLSARRVLLTRGLRLHAVLDESVLRRVVGGPAIFQDQVNHLAAMTGLSNVTIQIIPFGAGAHASMDGSFTMLMFEHGDPTAVFIDGGHRPLDGEPTARCYAEVFRRLCDIALTPADSAALIFDRAERPERGGTP